MPTTIKDTTPVKGWPTRYGSHATDETAPTEIAARNNRQAPAGGQVVFAERRAGVRLEGAHLLAAATQAPQPVEPEHSPGGSSGRASSLTAAGVNPFNHRNDGAARSAFRPRIPGCRSKPSYRPHRAISGRFAFRRRDLPGRVGAHRARQALARTRLPVPIHATGVRLLAHPRDYRSASRTACAG